jgi:hypothetical protein
LQVNGKSLTRRTTTHPLEREIVIHRIAIAFAILVFSLTAVAAGRSTAAVVLKVEAFKAGFRNCSRPTPQGMTSFWQVGQPALDRIDEALMVHLEKTGLAKKLRAAPASYGRQYLGYNRGERRFVYINAFLRSSGDPRSTYQRWCDGGNQFWGIEYDMKEKVFKDFEIDGVSGDPLEGLTL